MYEQRPEVTKQCWSIAEFCERHSISQTTVYKLINVGALKAVKICRRTVIPMSAEAEWLASLPAAGKSAA